MSMSYNENLQRNNTELEGILNTVNALPSGGGSNTNAIPSYWQAHIEEKVATVKALQDEGGRDCFSFVFITDTHFPSNLGKRSPALAKKIEAATGVETKFARLAHIVRGGNPNLRDRVMASRMGAYAVEELLRGNSNLVVCERDGKLTSTDIRYALILDRMYKNTLKEGDLESFTAEEVERMKAEVERKRAVMYEHYTLAKDINL